jgi:uncharacterized membrane protein YoaK (UPF0700 family)
MFETLQSRYSAVYAKYSRWVPIVGFVCGFLFDMVMLHRIDEPAVIIQQALYILITGVLIAIELFSHVQPVQPPSFLAKHWKHREFVLHFFLGTLLNSYTIFYFKSASGLTSFIFIIILVVALTLSEFKRFGEYQHQVHMGLWSLCLISYFQSLVPIIAGFMSWVLFLISGAISILVFSIYYKFVRKRIILRPELLRTHVLYPYVIVQTIFTILYFSHAIPPVPLSVSYIGIYHEVEKSEGEYLLSYQKVPYKFWQHGDDPFHARPGDVVIAFVQIFSPSGFKDQLQVRWLLHHDTLGWQSQDAIPLQVMGGREEGYRALTKKSNYQPGEWRVQIETMDGREVGSLRFTIIEDASTDERHFTIDRR